MNPGEQRRWGPNRLRITRHLTIDHQADSRARNPERVAASRIKAVNIGRRSAAHREARLSSSPAPRSARRSRSRADWALGNPPQNRALGSARQAKDAPLPASMIPMRGGDLSANRCGPGLSGGHSPAFEMKMVRHQLARGDLADAFQRPRECHAQAAGKSGRREFRAFDRLSRDDRKTAFAPAASEPEPDHGRGSGNRTADHQIVESSRSRWSRTMRPAGSSRARARRRHCRAAPALAPAPDRPHRPDPAPPGATIRWTQSRKTWTVCGDASEQQAGRKQYFRKTL